MTTTFVGVDVFVEAPLHTEFPKDLAGLSFKHAASRGLKLSGGNSASVLDVGWLCVRYSFVKPISGNGDKEIAEFLLALGQKYKWTSLVKLFDIDGKPAYS